MVVEQVTGDVMGWHVNSSCDEEAGVTPTMVLAEDLGECAAVRRKRRCVEVHTLGRGRSDVVDGRSHAGLDTRERDRVEAEQPDGRSRDRRGQMVQCDGRRVDRVAAGGADGDSQHDGLVGASVDLGEQVEPRARPDLPGRPQELAALSDG